MTVPWVDAAAIAAACTPAQAVAAIEAAVLGGAADSGGPGRIAVPLAHGEFLLMPAEAPGAVGIKVLTVAPGNTAESLPRIQGVYLLFDQVTLSPVAILDGIALTTLRTPAVSVAAVLPRLRLDSAPLNLVIFGAGPQAVAHEATVRSALAGVRDVGSVDYIVRDPQRAATALGATLLGARARVVANGSPAAASAIRDADLIVCATSAREPLFDSAVVKNTATLIAVGSHEPAARELDAALLARSSVVVETAAAALAEAGDVIQAIAEGAITPDALIPMALLISGAVRPPVDRPLVFKSVGMSWQDLAIAQFVVRA